LALAGGFTTNFIWYLILIANNKTGGELIGKPGRATDADGGKPRLLRSGKPV
jgi:hypothetical protein